MLYLSNTTWLFFYHDRLTKRSRRKQEFIPTFLQTTENTLLSYKALYQFHFAIYRFDSQSRTGSSNKYRMPFL